MLKRLVLLIVAFIVLIGFMIYAPELKYFFDEEYDESNIISAVFTYSTISEEITDRIIGRSYVENDEVKLEDLAYIQVSYWGFDDKEHIGELIVNTKVAEEVVEIFEELYEAKFPIEKIRLIDEYEANDDLSMSDNNTSAFCYREITGSKGQLSNHS